jgi:valine--pyruvate aminotransferase
MKNIQFSDFGRKLCGPSGINQLMDDIGKPLPQNIPVCQMGGGNPARIPEVEAMYRAQMGKILNHGDDFENLTGRYDAPQGRTSFIEFCAAYLSKTFGWNIGPENIAVTNGSQSAFFYLFNMFSGTCTEGVAENCRKIKKTVVFPLVPEYVGYADQGIESGTFIGIPAGFSLYPDHTFKYHIDFERLGQYLEDHDNAGALCVSRPTNPTGNVLTDDEIHHLACLAERHGVPLFVDNAYGLPWPDIIFSDAKPYWDENVVLSMSLSKIGLPALRTGIIIAQKELINAVSRMNAIAALASGSMGQALAGELIGNGVLVETAKNSVRPFYEKKSAYMQKCIHNYFSGTNYYIHKSEGSIFLWLLMPDLSIPTKELYKLLKLQGVFVMPGEYFFFGSAPDGSQPPVEEHPHFTKCLRLNYARPDSEISRAVRIISELYRRNCK